jgi:predicted esterase
VTEQKTRVSASLPVDYLLRKPAVPREVILLLHGYSQTGAKIFGKLEPFCPRDAAVLAVNGPFLTPVRTESGYSAGYSWYFYNPITDEYAVDMQTGVEYLAALLAQLGLDSLPIRVVGFSQGGYLAPFLARRCSKIAQVIGIGCEFLSDEIDFDVRFRMDAIHGGRDEVVSAASAGTGFRRMQERGVKGEWHCLPETGHRIDENVQQIAAGLLLK